MKTKTYRVTFVIEVDARSHGHAAEIVQEIMRDPESTATVFDVTDESGITHVVDLSDF